MTESALVGAAFGEFLEAARSGDGPAGARLALALIDEGASCDEVILELLAPTQIEVGAGWLDNDWSVADEHLASGVTQRALDAVASTVPTSKRRGSIVVTCAEGDWHSLPAQMFAELLHSHGYEVAFLGASTPVDHVSRLLARRYPDALAVSCTLPIFFAGLTRLADAAHGFGIPVIAGGRALGKSPARTLRLGGDAWASNIDTAVSILSGWKRDGKAVAAEATVLDASARSLDLDAPALAADGFGSLMATYPSMGGYGEGQLARTREDLEYIVRFLAAASLVEDPTVFSEFLAWLRRLLAARAVPDGALTAGLAALAPLVEVVDERAGRVLRET